MPIQYSACHLKGDIGTLTDGGSDQASRKAVHQVLKRATMMARTEKEASRGECAATL